MKCVACDKELLRKELLFAEDKQPYCANPFTCNEEHPNSVKNIVARAAAVRMFTEEELEENLFERLEITDEMKNRIMKVATKPQSIRLSKLEIAHYLIQLQDKKELTSISEAVRYCVQLAMDEEPIDSLGAPKQPKGEPSVVEETSDEPNPLVVEEFAHEIRKGVTIVPKVSAKDLIMNQIEEKEKEEEEFTF